MVGRCVDRMDLHQRLSGVGDVAQISRRSRHASDVRILRVDGPAGLGGSHLHPTLAAVAAQDLVCLRMGVLPDVTADGIDISAT
jgi:hypothetical protein